MGVGIGRNWSSSRHEVKYVTVPSQNPDPTKYKILRAENVNNCLVIELSYDGCTNYEGKKILLYDKGVQLIDLVNQRSIDPHFFEDSSKHSPIARFIPTERGWRMALLMADEL